MNRKNISSVKSAGIAVIIYAVVIILLEILFTYFDNERIWYSDAKTGSATIVSVGNVYSKRIKSGSTFIGRLYSRGEYRPVYYTYVVDGVEYFDSDTCRIYTNDSLNVGEEISITYSEKNNERSVIGNLQGISKYDIIASILFGLLGIMILFVESTPINDIEITSGKNKTSNSKSIGKNIELVVQKIEFIDIDREKIFFKDINGLIYLYESDFGEEFKLQKSYLVNLSRINKKNVKIKYDGNLVKAIRIINLEARDFIEKEGTLDERF